MSITSSLALTLTSSDGIVGNTAQSKVVSGLSFQGILAQYVQPQVIGISAPINLQATVSAGGSLSATTYYYQVTAINAVGETTGSAEVTAATTGANNTVKLTWAAVTGAASYRVYRGSAVGAENTYYAAGSNSFTDTGASGTGGTVPTSNTTALSAPGTVTPSGSGTGGTMTAATYYYKVTALNAVGETLASPEASVTTTGSTSSVALAWSAVTGATSYKVYRGTTTSGENTYNTTGTNSYTDTGTSAGIATVPTSNTTQVAAPGVVTTTPAAGGTLAAATYYYKVTTINATGETVGSAEVNVTTSGSTSAVTLTWGSVSGASSYRVYRGTSAGAESVYYGSATNSYLDTGASATSGTVPGSPTATLVYTPALTATPIQAFYLRNLSSNTVALTWTPQGGSSNKVIDLMPQAAIALLEPTAGNGIGGITAVTITASAVNTPIEAFWAA